VGLSTNSEQYVTPIADWNWAPEIFVNVPLPAPLVEALRSIKPVYFVQEKTWHYPLPTHGLDYIAAFDTWVAIVGGKQILTGAPSSGSPLGGLQLELTTGVVNNTGTPKVVYSGTGHIAAQGFALDVAELAGNLSTYAGNPQHHSVKDCIMQYCEIYSTGIDDGLLQKKPRPEKWALMRRLSVLDVATRRAAARRKKLPDELIMKLRIIDARRGVTPKTEDEFTSAKKAVPAQRKNDSDLKIKVADPVDLGFSTIIGVTSNLPINAANFGADTGFQFCYMFSNDPSLADVAGYLDSVEHMVATANELEFTGYTLRMRHLLQVHDQTAEDNSEDGAVLKSRLALGLGGGANSGSWANEAANIFGSSMKLLTMFL